MVYEILFTKCFFIYVYRHILIEPEILLLELIFLQYCGFHIHILYFRHFII